MCQLLSQVQLFATPWTVACQTPLSMGFPRQECWSRLPFPSPGNLPDPEIEPQSPWLQADSLPAEPPGKRHIIINFMYFLIILNLKAIVCLYGFKHIYYVSIWHLYCSVFLRFFKDFSGGTVDETLSANAGDTDSIPGAGRFHMGWSN